MEKEPKRGLHDPFIKDEVTKLEGNSAEIQEQLKSDIEYLNELILYMEEDKSYLEMMEEENKWIENDPEGAKEVGFAGHKKEAIEKVKQDIEKSKEIIREVNDSISSWTLGQSRIQAQIDEFRALEARFKEILLKIKPENLQ